MRLDEQFFEDFRCIVCSGKPFDLARRALSSFCEVEDLVGERCEYCGHQMSLEDLESMIHAIEIQMIRSLFTLH